MYIYIYTVYTWVLDQVVTHVLVGNMDVEPRARKLGKTPWDRLQPYSMLIHGEGEGERERTSRRTFEEV